jgi:uncharacterized phage-associated protein
MAYTFKADKTVQAVAALLKREYGKRTNYMRLLKLLYLADRVSIQETGRPITGDRVYAMDRGPVLGNVLNLIKSEHPESTLWDWAIQKNGYDIELVADPGNGSLSRYELRKLHEVSAEHVDHDEWDMVRITHELPEWKLNEPQKGSRKDISVEDILDAVGRGADKEDILADAEYARRMDRVFGKSTTLCDTGTHTSSASREKQTTPISG